MRHLFYSLLAAAVMLGAVALLSGCSDDPATVRDPVAVITPTAATSTVQPACLSIDQVLDLVKAQVPNATHEVFSGQQAKAYVEAFNALPPASATPLPDMVILFSSVSMPNVYLAGFGGGGCQFLRGTLTLEQHKAIVAKITSTI
jgi:hypothetical protein